MEAGYRRRDESGYTPYETGGQYQGRRSLEEPYTRHSQQYNEYQDRSRRHDEYSERDAYDRDTGTGSQQHVRMNYDRESGYGRPSRDQGRYEYDDSGSRQSGYGSPYGGHGSQHGGQGSRYGGQGSQYGGYGTQYGGQGSQDGGYGSQYGGQGSQDGDYRSQGYRAMQGHHGFPGYGMQEERYGSSQGSTRYWDQSGEGNYGGSRENSSQRTPKNYTRSDSRIQEDVNDRFMQASNLDPSDIEVKAQNGEVTLTGTVPTRHEKFRAEQIAEAVLGVKDVTNQLRVKKNQSADDDSSSSGSRSASGAAGSSTSSSSNQGASTSSQQRSYTGAAR